MEEIIDLKIKQFLEVPNGDGWGSGSGWGWGWGSGSGSGLGSSSGSGLGWGSGWGSGEGSGDGSGEGEGSGDGSGEGWGSGWGSGEGISSVNNEKVYIVDGVPTIIRKVNGNFAKGAIFNRDLTFTPCFIAKQGSVFAHGETLSKAVEALQEKIMDGAPEEERIQAFVAAHEKDAAYSNRDYFRWHHTLTGSCEAGRSAFAKDHEIDLNAEMTPMEFILLTENAYGGSTIKKLKTYYE